MQAVCVDGPLKGYMRNDLPHPPPSTICVEADDDESNEAARASYRYRYDRIAVTQWGNDISTAKGMAFYRYDSAAASDSTQ